MHNVLFALAVILGFVTGWFPTETNTVDLVSLFNFAVACVAAYAWGWSSK